MGTGADWLRWPAPRQGVDEFFGYLNQWRAHFYWPELLMHNGDSVPLKGNETKTGAPPLPRAGRPVNREVPSHDYIADEALGVIENNRNRPFFLYGPFTIPHVSL